jgi:hypothetical protein
MDQLTRSAAAAVALVFVLLSACGTGRTMVMEPPAEKKSYATARLERADDSVAVPEELSTMFREQLRAELYGTAEQPGPFTEGDNLTIRVKVVQFEAGSQFERWFWGGIGNQGEASMQLMTEFFDGDRKPANIQTEGRIGSGFFGGSVKSAVQKATSEISTYAVQNFADPARAEAFLRKK